MGDRQAVKVGDKVRVLRTDYPEIPVDTITHVVSVFGEDVSLWCEESTDGLFFFREEYEPVAVADSNGNLRIETGKFYRTRDGRKVGPMVKWNAASEWPWSDHMHAGTYIWRDNGTSGDIETDNDLIAEWTDDEPVAANDDNDWYFGKTDGFTVPHDLDDMPPGAEATSGKDEEPDALARFQLCDVFEAKEMARAGIFTINEVRKKFGLPPISSGDKLAA